MLQSAFEEYGDDGFLPVVVMWQGSPEDAGILAAQLNLTYPVITDLELSLFDRWNTLSVTPSTTVIERGVRVEAIDTTIDTTILDDRLR
ncbi:MAG: hypothetical protein AAFV53_36725 [Myxococcota bacterium]